MMSGLFNMRALSHYSFLNNNNATSTTNHDAIVISQRLCFGDFW